MSSSADRIISLLRSLAALLEHEIAAHSTSARELAASTGDPRLRRLAERLELLGRIALEDHISKIDDLASELADAHAPSEIELLLALAAEPPGTLDTFCGTLLDRLMEATAAERAFTLFYLPESTEASVVAERNFRTTNLSLGEYDFSRTVLRRVLERGEPLLLEDASSHPEFRSEASVRALELRSVLAAPLRHGGRTVGAIYLENRASAGAFDAATLRLATTAACFAAGLLAHARLLPHAFGHDSPVFLDESKASSEIVGRDPGLLALLDVIHRVADAPATVLIEGESGTGKELVARALHYGSSRRNRPFVAINCAAIPETLLESQLFGHERGAFTGATERRLGLIEQAAGGTFFLDEISELQLSLQAKLLRFLQSGELQRLGGRETIRVDVRVVAASSRSLREMTDAGAFLDALFYRLNVIPLRVPPLRERRGDIPLLIDRFLERFSALYGRRMRIEPAARALVAGYPFPGNVRELENLVHRLVALSRDGLIRAGDLPPEIAGTTERRVHLGPDPLERLLASPPSSLEELRRRREEVRHVLNEQERDLAERAIAEAGGNVTEAAERLGIHRVTLHKIVRRSGGDA